MNTGHNISFPHPNYITLICLFGVFLIYSCSTTKHVAEDDFLLDKYKSEIDNKAIDKKELNSYIRPKPNKRILGVKFYLWLYNLSGDKDNGLNRWLKSIGEEPVVWNEFEVDKNSERIQLYMRNKGYYYSFVKDTTRFKKQKARVRYTIESGDPYLVRNIIYQFKDTTIRNLIIADTMNSLIKRNEPFDVDVLQLERARVEYYLKSLGYYNFSREYIEYKADSSRRSLKVDLTAVINEFQLKTRDDYIITVPHRKYQINKVLVLPDFDQKRALLDFDSYLEGLKKLEYKEFEFYYDTKLRINPKVVSQSIYLLPGNLYNIEDVNQSYKHLSSLRIFQSVNFQFLEADPGDAVNRDYYQLDCYIHLSPSTLQSYTVELEGTNSSGNVGVAGNLNYLHRNLFGGAEAFNFRIKGAMESIKKSNDRGLDKMVELGAETRLTIPQFLLPFRTENFIRKYNPKTNILIAYNYQDRPDYERSLANTTFGYNWQASRTMFHVVNPFELNFVNMMWVSGTYWDQIKDTYLRHSYEDRLIVATNYTFIYNNQTLNKLTDYVYFRSTVEQSGNIITAANSLFGTPNENGLYELFENEYAQYIKGDIDMRYYHIIDDKTNLVYRLFVGAAYPYGNSIAIPFEKQFFSGGANGVRAWPVRDLGPGTFFDTTSVYPNKTADIKLEANVEYRFKLFWILEGALFLDAGNIWAIREEDDRQGALFRWNSFYNEIAVGTGAGLRMDFNFFVMRLDVGYKLLDPINYPRNYRPSKRPQFNIAIGYPF